MPPIKKKPEKTEAEVCQEATSIILNNTKKSVYNRDIIILVAAFFRQRSLDRVMRPELLSELRSTLRMLSKLPDVGHVWINWLLNVLEENENEPEVVAPEKEETNEKA